MRVHILAARALGARMVFWAKAYLFVTALIWQGQQRANRLSLEEASFESVVTLVRHLQNLCELCFFTEAI
jgi:isopentenyl diphosphate isomerase/L-lactate dehydrogenase-like FMN-dependent dehydrogenase